MADLQRTLIQRPSGLVFDIDGTLSPIAPTPDQARLYPGAADLLAKAAQHAHVAIMTGRAVENGASMLNLEGLTYIGSHGLEWSAGLPATHQIQVAPEAIPYIEPASRLLNLAEAKLVHIPGILVERKRIGGAIHYRLSADPEQTRQFILDTLREPARQQNLVLSEGKKVVEIKAATGINKGVALRRFVQQAGLKGVLFAGDDRTDLDAILEIKRLQGEGFAAIAIVVQHTDTLPELLNQADMVVQEVEGMVHLLNSLVETLQKQA